MNNEKLVEESIELVEKMRLFSSKKINIEGIEEVNDFQLAQELAYDYDEYIIDGEECYTWDDIKELEMSRHRTDSTYLSIFKKNSITSIIKIHSYLFYYWMTFKLLRNNMHSLVWSSFSCCG